MLLPKFAQSRLDFIMSLSRQFDNLLQKLGLEQNLGSKEEMC